MSSELMTTNQKKKKGESLTAQNFPAHIIYKCRFNS